jgi:arylsulfatase A-like enzyme/cytochrome c-type biogenesis protein CcmH/NrfG
LNHEFNPKFMAVMRRLLFVLTLSVIALSVSALTSDAQTAGALAPAHKSSSPGKKPSNIILITLDTTRADRMGFLGSKLGLTPNLDALAKQSIVFTRAYSQVPLTPPSHAAILTGTYPQFNHVNDMQDPLAKHLPYAPEILRAHGYRTAAFIGAIVLEPSPPFAVGFDRGFDTYDAGFHSENPGDDRYKTVQRRGSQVVAHALAWLNKNPKGPFFIWIHLYDAHDPYDPPEPYKTRYASAPYDGGIAYEDAVVGRLLRELKLRGLYDGTIMAVMADHGESLGAHGEDTHGVFLYDETIRVPLLIKMPHANAGGERIDNRVELIDILPTLLQATSIEIPKEIQGKSLLGLMERANAGGNPAVDAWHDRPAYAQSEYPHNNFGWSALRSLRSEKYLYIQAPQRELYDETADPGAEHNLAASSKAVADTLAGQLQALRQETVSTREAPTVTLDPEAQAKLGALGYMASTDTKSKANSDDGPDPKDKVEIANMIHRAEMLQQDLHSDESIALLEQIIAKNPTSAFYAKLGDWLMRTQNFEKAEPALRKALELDPDSTGTRFHLAKCFMLTRDYSSAIPELEKVIAKVPDAVEAHSYLELAYAKTDRVSDAIKECQTMLQFDPNDYGSYLILGQSLARSGDPEGGVKALKKAISIQPQIPLAHVWLADAYEQMGRKADAMQERAEAKRLQAN